MDLAELLRRSHKVQVGNLLGATLSLSHHKRSRHYDSGDLVLNAQSTDPANSLVLISAACHRGPLCRLSAMLFWQQFGKR